MCCCVFYQVGYSENGVYMMANMYVAGAKVLVVGSQIIGLFVLV